MRISYWSSDVCSSDLEDRGIGARQFPRAEERRPIDIFAQIGQIPIVENMQARQLGRGRLERHIGGKAACARLLDRQQRVLPLALARLAYRIILRRDLRDIRSDEHTSELQSLMRHSYPVFCLKKKNKQN